jgi:hypothetical protein
MELNSTNNVSFLSPFHTFLPESLKVLVKSWNFHQDSRKRVNSSYGLICDDECFLYITLVISDFVKQSFRKCTDYILLGKK